MTGPRCDGVVGRMTLGSRPVAFATRTLVHTVLGSEGTASLRRSTSLIPPAFSRGQAIVCGHLHRASASPLN